jgi:hypothetical protein
VHRASAVFDSAVRPRGGIYSVPLCVRFAYSRGRQRSGNFCRIGTRIGMSMTAPRSLRGHSFELALLHR